MSMMTIDLYQSATNGGKFLAVQAGVDAAELTGPMVFDKDYGELVLFRKGFEFDPTQSYAGANAAKIAADILTVKWAIYERAAESA